jgi:hypothetical protein
MNEREFARRAVKRLRKNANQLQFTYSSDEDIAQDAQEIIRACDVLQSNIQDVRTGLVLKDVADKVGALASKLEAVMRKHRRHFLASNFYIRGLLVYFNTYNPSECPAEVSCELKSTAVMLQLMSTAAELPESVSPELPEVPESGSAELPQRVALPILQACSYPMVPQAFSPCVVHPGSSSPPYASLAYEDILDCFVQLPAGNREPELTENFESEHEKKEGGN